MNNPHEQQTAAMDRAGELPDGEQLRNESRCEICKCTDWCAEYGCWTLRECVNSGQVSAAQVVAHAESGETCIPTPAQALAEMVARASALSIDARLCAIAQPSPQVVAHAEAGELPSLPVPIRNKHGVLLFSANQMRAYATTALAAERAEVARLREALSDSRNYIEATTLNASSRQTRDNYRGCLRRIDAALGQNQEENEHD